MDRQKAEAIIERIAKDHGISEEKIRREIELALEKSNWSTIPREGERPTPEEAIMYLEGLVKEKMK